MVYAALPLALVAGGALQGALVMLAFGLGTLPNMLAVDVAVHGIGRAGQAGRARTLAWVRPLAGAAIVVFGISGLAHAARVAGVAGSEHPAIAMFARICHH
jgi:sulfite exporter TauE/SafE